MAFQQYRAERVRASTATSSMKQYNLKHCNFVLSEFVIPHNSPLADRLISFASHSLTLAVTA